MLILTLTSLIFAQVTAVSVTYDVGDRQQAVTVAGPFGYGGTITVTATGSWTVNLGTCSSLSLKTSSGSGNGTTRFSWDTTSNMTPSAGNNYVDSSCSGTVTGASSSSVGYTINRRVWRKGKKLFVTDMNGNTSWSGYTAPSAASDYPFEGSANSSFPPHDGVAFPALGGTWTDPIFGGIWKRVGATNDTDYQTPYNAMRFSRGGTYAWTRKRGIFAVSDPTTVVAPGPWTVVTCGSADNGFVWSQLEDLTGYCYDNTTKTKIRKFTVTPGLPGTITEVCSPGNSPPCGANAWYTHASNLTNSGSAGGTGAGTAITMNDEMLMMVSGTSQVCMIDLRPSKRSSACTDIPSGRDMRGSMVAPRPDRMSGFTYGFVVSESPNYVLSIYRYTTDSLSLVGDIPRANARITENGYNYGTPCTPANSECVGLGGHIHFWSTLAGHGIIGNATGARSYPNYYSSFGAIRLGAEQFASQPEESGGGFVSTHGQPDEYGVCAMNAPVCIQAHGPQDDRVRSVTCTGDGATVTCAVSAPLRTTDGSNPGFSGTNIFTNGQRVLFNRLSVSAWNGYKTLNGSSGSNITFADTTTGTNITGWVTVAAFLDTAQAKKDHIIACRVDNGHCRIVTKGAAAVLNETYEQLPHLFPAPDGGRFLLNSPFGYPGELNTFMLDTGFRCKGTEAPSDFCDGAGGLDVVEEIGSVTFKVRAPWPTAVCSVEYDSLIDHSNPTTSLGTGSRNVVISGLSAGDTRYARAYCEGVSAVTGAIKQNWHYAIAKATAR